MEDDIAISADGTVIYGESGNIYSSVSGAIVSNWGSVSGADGIGVIDGNDSLNGDLVVNSNFGDVVLVELNNADTQVVLADAGSRGNYVGDDWSNGTLLLTQTDRLERVSCGAGCSIGSPPLVNTGAGDHGADRHRGDGALGSTAPPSRLTHRIGSLRRVNRAPRP